MKRERGGFRMLRHEQLFPELEHDSYRTRRKLPESTQCPDCGALYRRGRWTRAAPGPRPSALARCPACRRLRERLPAGYVSLSGAFFASHRAEILARVRSCEAQQQARHPLERIMRVAPTKEGVLVTTTGLHLARRIGDALREAYKGRLDYRYNKAENLLRVAWSR